MKEETIGTREFGIDALRLFSMFGIVLMHILYRSGLLESDDRTIAATAWLVELICYCAVNCYAMISGYVRYGKQTKKLDIARYICMWLEVLTWSLGITLFAFLTHGGIGARELLRSALPVVTRAYWYFTAYTVLFFIMPYLDRLICALSTREHTRFCVTMLLLFSIVGLLGDPFGIDYSYSFVWLIVMYILDSLVKRCELVRRLSVKTAVLVSVICIVLSLCVLMLSPLKADALAKYISPTTVVHGVCVLTLFAKLKLGRSAQKLVHALSPAAFGVYIIHEHPLIKPFLESRLSPLCELEPYAAVPMAIACALVVFLVCLALSRLRAMLSKLLHIEDAVRKMCVSVGKMARKTLTK